MRIGAVTFGCAFAGWVLFVAGFQPGEMLVGLLCAIACAAFITFTIHEDAGSREFCMHDLAEVRRVPLSIVVDAWVVCRVLFAALLLRRPARSGYLTVHFETRSGNARDTARRALAVTYATASPNAIALGAHHRAQRILLHQLEPSSAPDVICAMARVPQGRR